MTDRTQTAGRWYRSPFILPNGKPSFSEVWASSQIEAQHISDVRGFGRAVPYNGPKLREFRPSKLAEALGVTDPNVLHSLAYVGFLAARSGAISAAELVEDGSAIHELAHAIIGPKMKGGQQVKIAIEAMRALERRTPGIPPDSVEMEMPKPFSTENEQLRREVSRLEQSLDNLWDEMRYSGDDA